MRSRQPNCFGGEFFGVESSGVTRFQKAVAQGVRPARPRTTDTPFCQERKPSLTIAEARVYLNQRLLDEFAPSVPGKQSDGGGGISDLETTPPEYPVST